jgi:hypothetical protein
LVRISKNKLGEGALVDKIQRISFLFRVLFQVSLILVPIFVVLFWISAPIAIGENTQATIIYIPELKQLSYEIYTRTSEEIFTILTLQGRIAGFLINLIPTIISMLVLFFFSEIISLI